MSEKPAEIQAAAHLVIVLIGLGVVGLGAAFENLYLFSFGLFWLLENRLHRIQEAIQKP